MLPLIIRLCYEPARRLCARHWNDNRQELYMCLLVTLPSERTPSYSPECWERLAWMRSNLKQRGGAAFLERRAKPTTRSKWERLSRERVRAARERTRSAVRRPIPFRSRESMNAAARPRLPSTAALWDATIQRASIRGAAVCVVVAENDRPIVAIFSHPILCIDLYHLH